MSDSESLSHSKWECKYHLAYKFKSSDGFYKKLYRLANLDI